MATAKKPAAKAATAKTGNVKKAVRAPAALPAAKPEKPAAPAVVKTAPVPAAKAEKARKPKLVRDSFTIPKSEYGVIGELKERAAKAGAPAKKSEVLRAGIKALAAMNDAALLAALRAVPAIKTGRPAGG